MLPSYQCSQFRSVPAHSSRNVLEMTKPGMKCTLKRFRAKFLAVLVVSANFDRNWVDLAETAEIRPERAAARVFLLSPFFSINYSLGFFLLNIEGINVNFFPWALPNDRKKKKKKRIEEEEAAEEEVP